MSGVGLSSLEMELLAQVIEFVDDSSPHTTKSAALVSKKFNDATRLVGHRRKILVLNGLVSTQPDARSLVSKWLADPSILSGMRHLRIIDGDIDDYAYQVIDRERIKTHVESQSLAIIELLSNTGKLKSLTWDSESCIGVKVLEALKACKSPTCGSSVLGKRSVVVHQDLSRLMLEKLTNLQIIPTHD